MHSLGNYQIFLFDFDGTLVNTELLHYQAYVLLCQKFGYPFPWDFPAYCQRAHYSNVAVKEGLYKVYPELAKISWDDLYKEKKKIYLELLENWPSTDLLMPGVEQLLNQLTKNATTAVVTNSPQEQTEMICKRAPILNTIGHWITREHYTKTKPDPESYEVAIRLLRKRNERVIGFEDSPRGLEALMGVEADAVLISGVMGEEAVNRVRVGAAKPFKHFDSFSSFLLSKG